MLLKVRVEGSSVRIERIFSDGKNTTVVMPVSNAGQAALKGEQLGRLFGLQKTGENVWENLNG